MAQKAQDTKSETEKNEKKDPAAPDKPAPKGGTVHQKGGGQPKGAPKEPSPSKEDGATQKKAGAAKTDTDDQPQAGPKRSAAPKGGTKDRKPTGPKTEKAETSDQTGGKRTAKKKGATPDVASDATPVSSSKPGEEPPPKPAGEPARETLAENPLHRKLGLRPGITGLVIAPPEDTDNVLLPLPENFRIVPDVEALASVDGQADYLHFFARNRGELARVVVLLREKLAPGGSLWVSWIKQSSSRRREGLPGDLNENVIRRLALTSGLVDVKVVALDQDWSALRLVHRRH